MENRVIQHGLMKTFHFCTSLALGGIPKLLALIGSLNSHLEEQYNLWVLCEDDYTKDVLTSFNLQNVFLENLGLVEDKYPALLEVKTKRDAFEYNCTLRPAWIHYVLDTSDAIHHVTYLDTDLYFFSDPSSIYEDLDQNSVLLSPHRLSRLALFMGVSEKTVGSFNAGWVVFKNDLDARRVLEWWHLRCIEWCFRKPEAGRFGEQKYLDGFFNISTKVGVVRHKGVNLAPWNMNDHRISVNKANQVLIDDDVLIFFHFHALKVQGERSFKVEKELGTETLQLTNPSYVVSDSIRTLIYEPYLKELRSSVKDLEEKGVNVSTAVKHSEFPRKIRIRARSRLVNVFAIIALKFLDLLNVLRSRP